MYHLCRILKVGTSMSETVMPEEGHFNEIITNLAIPKGG
jgi:hypothetical protein